MMNGENTDTKHNTAAGSKLKVHHAHVIIIIIIIVKMMIIFI